MSDSINTNRKSFLRRILFTCFLLFAGLPISASPADPPDAAGTERLSPPPAKIASPVSVWTSWSIDGIRVGDSAVLAVILDIQQGFHVNADAGQLVAMADFRPIPTRVTVTRAPATMRLESPQYPPAKAVRVAFASGELMSFEGRAVVYLPMTLIDETETEKIRIALQVQYQACDDRVCLFPRQVTLETALPVMSKNAAPVLRDRHLFADYRPAAAPDAGSRIDFDLFGWQFSLSTGSGWGFASLLLVAGLGGFLLNFTPCVLPLIPIKIISLSNAAQDQSRCLALGLTMSIGVLGFWLTLGGAIALVAGFTATNQLFQYPLFTISIGIIIAVMALGMCGLFSVSLPGFIYRINPNQESLHGSFLLGILTAILSTPCTAPFMGAAAAWAATRHTLTTLTTFAFIGFGMALPYLVLSASPQLVSKMPRTGPASVLIKQVMGFFMLAAAAYFIGTGISSIMVKPPNPPDRFFWWIVMLLLGAGGVWLAVRTIQITSARLLQFVFAGLGLLIFVGSVFGALKLTDKGPVDWVYYTPQRFKHAIEQRQAVVLVFTAEWCLNCKAMEQGVLNSREVASLLASDDVVPMKADITGNNVWGKEKLQELGHLTIPLLVVFSSTGAEVFRSDFYTVGQVLQAVSKARSVRGTDASEAGPIDAISKNRRSVCPDLSCFAFL